MNEEAYAAAKVKFKLHIERVGLTQISVIPKLENTIVQHVDGEVYHTRFTEAELEDIGRDLWRMIRRDELEQLRKLRIKIHTLGNAPNLTGFNAVLKQLEKLEKELLAPAEEPKIFYGRNVSPRVKVLS